MTHHSPARLRSRPPEAWAEIATRWLESRGVKLPAGYGGFLADLFREQRGALSVRTAKERADERDLIAHLRGG